jgi:DNA-binding MarR family transcriptional regulator
VTARFSGGSGAPGRAAGAEEAVEWLSEAEQAAWRQLLSVQSELRERLDSELRAAHGLSLGDYGVLVHLAEAGPDGLRMSELAERILLSRSGLTRRIDTLTRHGLVARRPCPDDGRGAMALLTAAGAERLAAAAPTHVAGVRRYLIDVLSDLEGLRAGLDLVQAALHKDGRR